MIVIDFWCGIDIFSKCKRIKREKSKIKGSWWATCRFYN